ncbi:oligopeptide/dipeptide ABC transporter ATP-binding protein [Paenibacillus ihuae]|uniref:oligopeptide/dipeptide ABC transporter ATP-binding protein n=1 Tax=Paenibacillus ihuae TaxID=1232431 RepID=UPI0009EC2023
MLHPGSLNSILKIPDKPENKQEMLSIQGEIPSPLNPPDGCAFHPRCPYALDTCKVVKPQQRRVAEGHFAMGNWLNR